MPQSPCSTSETRTHVRLRRLSPSTSIIASVTFSIIACFWLELNTPLITSIVTSGIWFSLGGLESGWGGAVVLSYAGKAGRSLEDSWRTHGASWDAPAAR